MDTTKLRKGFSEQVGLNLTALAGMHNVTQNDLALRLGMSRQGIHNLFAGRSTPRGGTSIAIAELFGISVEDLYSETGDALRAAAASYETAPIRN